MALHFTYSLGKNEDNALGKFATDPPALHEIHATRERFFSHSGRATSPPLLIDSPLTSPSTIRHTGRSGGLTGDHA
jgi:hypothetical protein